MKDIFTVIGVGLILGLLLCFPLAQIWALNTIVPMLSIPYNFYSWLAVVILNASWFSKPLVQKVKVTN